MDFLLSWVAAPVAAVALNCNLWEWPLTLVLLLAVAFRWLPQRPVWVSAAIRCGHNRWLAYLTPILLLLLLRVALLPWRPVPLPYVPDEWSHRLLAETLVAGRLANPPHPLWPFFETIHVLPLPHYASMYLPGPALFLALGQVLFHSYYSGVILSCIGFVLAAVWAFRGWLSPWWSWWGGILAVLKVLLNGSDNGYWIHSYWGGSVGALGGALVVGAAGRWRAGRSSAVTGLVFGVGLVILAATRPLEGAVLCSAVIGWALWTRPWRQLTRAAAVASVITVAGGAGLAMYCKSVTGSYFRLPYFENQQRYGWPMTAVWMTPVKKTLEHGKLADYWDWELDQHQQIDSVAALAEYAPLKTSRQWHHFAGPLLTPPLIYGLAALRRRRTRLLGWLSLLGLVLVATEQSGFAHYYAPFGICLVGVVVLCCREWVRRDRRFATTYLTWVPFALLLVMGIRAASPAIRRPEQMPKAISWCCRFYLGESRQNVVDRLERQGGAHVVFVRYSRRDLNFTFDWVYNPPDIDAAPIIFARDRGEKLNQQLRDYYPNRQFWLAIPDKDPVVLEPYDPVKFVHGNHPPHFP